MVIEKTSTNGAKDGKKNLRHLRDKSEADVTLTKSPNVSKKAKTKKLRVLSEVDSLEIATLEAAEGCVSANPQEQIHLNEYLYMLKTNSRLIRKLKRHLLSPESKLDTRAIYSLSTVMSQQREVINDIRSVSDLSQQVHILDENVLQPLARSLGQNLLDSFYQMRKLIAATSDVKQTQFALKKHDEIVKEQGKYLQQQYQQALEQMSKALLGK